MNTPPRTQRILIVEDDSAQAFLLREALVEGGFQVDVAGNGVEAMRDFAQRGLPGLILLDLALPWMSGREVLEALQRNPIAREIPVIVVTGAAHDLPGACAAVVTKPVDVMELKRLVGRYVSAAASTRDHSTGCVTGPP